MVIKRINLIPIPNMEKVYYNYTNFSNYNEITKFMENHIKNKETLAKGLNCYTFELKSLSPNKFFSFFPTIDEYVSFLKEPQRDPLIRKITYDLINQLNKDKITNIKKKLKIKSIGGGSYINISNHIKNLPKTFMRKRKIRSFEKIKYFPYLCTILGTRTSNEIALTQAKVLKIFLNKYLEDSKTQFFMLVASIYYSDGYKLLNIINFDIKNLIKGTKLNKLVGLFCCSDFYRRLHFAHQEFGCYQLRNQLRVEGLKLFNFHDFYGSVVNSLKIEDSSDDSDKINIKIYTEFLKIKFKEKAERFLTFDEAFKLSEDEIVNSINQRKEQLC